MLVMMVWIALCLLVQNVKMEGNAQLFTRPPLTLICSPHVSVNKALMDPRALTELAVNLVLLMVVNAVMASVCARVVSLDWNVKVKSKFVQRVAVATESAMR